MRALALAPLLSLVSCSGGGGDSFTPSANIAATHGFLRAVWQGTGTSDAAPGQQLGCRMGFFPQGVSSSCSGEMYGPLFVEARNGVLQADGDRLRFSGWNFYDAGRVEADLQVVDNQTRLVGTYRVTFPATATAAEESHSGTVNLLRGAAIPQYSATIEHFEVVDAPDFLLVVRATYTEPAK